MNASRSQCAAPYAYGWAPREAVISTRRHEEVKEPLQRIGETKSDTTFKTKGRTTNMILPVQTSFRNMHASEAVAARVREEADKLDKYFDRITSCRVMVEAPHRHHRRGDSYHIRIELGVPGKELVVAHEPTLKNEDQREWHKQLEVEGPHKDVYVAIRDAFKAMRRQLKDYVHCLRHDVKTHHPGPHAKVSKIFSKEGYGFIVTPDGREIYFHKNSVLNSSFEHLDLGDEVIFSEEAGDNGAQATTVRRAGKHHAMGMPEE